MKRSKGAILMYHSVDAPASDAWGITVSRDRFDAHLNVLRQEFKPVSLDRVATGLVAGDLPERWIAVTFDDGYANNLRVAKPLLTRHRVPATVFIVTGKIDATTEFWWDEIERIFLDAGALPASLELLIGDEPQRFDLGTDAHWSAQQAAQHVGWRAWNPVAPTRRHKVYRALHAAMVGLPHETRHDVLRQVRSWSGGRRKPREGFRTMTTDEVRSLVAGGLIDVGSHTVTHTPLHLVDGDERDGEITSSKGRLEEILGRTVTTFSYPFGSRQPATVDAVRAAGYDIACASLGHDDVCALPAGAPAGTISMFTAPSHLFELPRIMVEDWRAPELRDRLARWFQD